MYRKSYAGFMLWLIAFVAAVFVICFLPGANAALMTRLLSNLCTAGIALLTWMVWHTENVYWYTGVDFEMAEKAGSERRKAYALRHFRLFGGYALAALAATLGACLLGMPWWVDFTAIGIGLIAAAFRTMAYKL